MPQSIAYNYSHITFSTKDRYPFIDENIQEELFRYIGGICNNMDFKPVKIGGYRDHVHILCVLSRKVALMKFMEEVKAHSSKWIKTKGEKYQRFYWQRGYGSFSVNPAEIDVVIRYIENQAEHHRSKTFQEEYLAFLKKYKVEYDERYLWD
jgi:REP element-mobilizing transposase RayT